MPDPLILAIDNGTQSVRALLFDLRGDIVAKSQVHLQAYFSTHPGWAEHDADGYWQAVCQACRQLWDMPGADRARVAGVAVTTQRGTVVNLDREGRPLRPAITWLDQRRTEQVPPIGPLWRTAFKLARVADTIDYFRGEAEINWIAAHQPEVWQATDKFLLLSGWLNYRLCGRFVDSSGSQVAYLPFDYKRRRWAAARDWKWQALAVAPHMLPELAEPGTRIGSVTAAAAQETGIPEGLPLLAAAADKACEVIGAGCREPHVGCLSYGTTATINTTSSRYVEVTPFVPPYPAAIPGAYSTEVQVFRGYWMVNWFKEQFGHHEQARALQEDVAPERLFDELANAVPPGSMGLMLQPYWTPGIRVPGREAKGAIIGFGDVHTRAHVYRAILEGLAYALREGKERIEKRSGTPITELRVSGGGSQSDAAMQLTADIFGLPTSRPHVYETSGLGAAIDAAVGLGLHPDFTRAVNAMTRVGRVFEPIPENRAIYERLYREVYVKMYRRLQPMYRDIARITGYPRQA
ncbi:MULTISPECIES: FGGY-family carbohydrate kinase [unclassified Massilia]|uniref:FGGY-family carbohydrate kinase n=1 Tax=unclassified Massilia TaxID=2609279 RepID=UPI001B8435BA|nr:MULTISPECIES: FGGY-family carbohydrate kinase [unclassified Massilia]MBQ5938957.1 FGGY-family carbohydrate kinase [Massilia sp. AB1]MBQ5962492.1 FGGY-family carbohydrate kinase [Massilia sp. ZL223]